MEHPDEILHRLVHAVVHLCREHADMSALTDKLKALAAEQKNDLAILAGLSDDSSTGVSDALAAFQANGDAIKAIIAAHQQPAAPTGPTGPASDVDGASTVLSGTASPVPAAPVGTDTGTAASVGGATILSDGTRLPV